NRPRLSPDPAERKEEFEQLLRETAERSGRRILFLLDGLDEVAQHDGGFPKLVFDNRIEGVLWVCAGRGEGELGAQFKAADEGLFPEGLPGLDKASSRAVLDLGCDRSIYALIRRDAEDTPAGGNVNPFLDELILRSAGLPLYLRLVVRDIWSAW